MALPTLATPEEERIRAAQLVGESPSEGFLIRSPSSMRTSLQGDSGVVFGMIAPELRVQWNSSIPFSQNDGALWAGRGASGSLMFGAVARYGRASLVLAPVVTYSANRDFALLPDSLVRVTPAKSEFVAPWYTGDFVPEWYTSTASIDMPMRFGERPYATIDPGQSSLTLTFDPLAVGVATENQWWGPGVRNALVMSNQAAGIPHAFVRTARALRTPVGDVEGRLMAGGLTESLFYDTVSTNSLRSISAFALTFRPRPAPNLTLGIARAVYSAADDRARIAGNAIDALIDWRRRSDVDDDTWESAKPQILSLFGRWVAPESGFETYAEWSRHELPASFRDFLTSPHHTQAYTLGFDWANRHRYGLFRLQAETTFMEFSPTFRHRPWNAHYTSRAVPQGYTHRGQVIGAAVGPGSANAWFAIDHFVSRYELGAFVNRVRWQAEALQRSVPANEFREFRSFHAWDLSLIGGVRGAVRFGGFRVGAELAQEQRLNFLFQNPDVGFGSTGAVDVSNTQFRLTVSPVAVRRER